jgi:hypothetical protein
VNKLQKIVSLTILFIFIVGCGYRPTSEFVKNRLGSLVYIKSIISLKNPTNSVIVKDALVESIIKKTSAKIVNSASIATSRIYIEFKSVKLTSLQKDEEGYDITFETAVKINIKVTRENKTKSYNLVGHDVFGLEAGGISSDIKKKESIKNASIKAINEFLSRIGI